MTERLLQLSGIVVDLIYWVEALPEAGEEAIVTDFALSPGGGFNAMAAAKRAGMEVAYGGGIGKGPFAQIVDKRLASEQIPVLQPAQHEIDQGCCTVLIDRTGERTFIGSEGADGRADLETLTRLPIADFTWCLLSGYALHYAGARDAFGDWLRRADPIPNLVFDPAPIVAVVPHDALQAAMSRAAWISANRREAAMLTSETDPSRAAEQLASERSGGAVVRSGAEGCFVATGGCARHVPSYHVQPIDTNGAGDTHVGSFIAALADGADPEEAAHYANIAAALSTTERGPATAPTRIEVGRILNNKEAI